MNKKVLIALAFVVLIFGIIAFYTTNDRHIESSDLSQGTLIVISDTPEEIRISEPEKNEYVITLTDQGYYITELLDDFEGSENKPYPADPDQVKKLVGELNTLMRSSPASANPERHAYYETTNDSGTRLSIKDGNAVQTLYIGREGATFPSFFVRLDGEDSVYLVKENIKAHVSKPFNAWRDPRILAGVQADQLTEITYIEHGVKHTLTQSDQSWLDTNGTEVPESAIEGIIKQIINLRAQDYDDEATAASTGLESSPQAIFMLTTGDDEITLKAGRPFESQVQLISSQNEHVYLVAEAVLERITSVLENY